MHPLRERPGFRRGRRFVFVAFCEDKRLRAPASYHRMVKGPTAALQSSNLEDEGVRTSIPEGIVKRHKQQGRYAIIGFTASGSRRIRFVELRLAETTSLKTDWLGGGGLSINALVPE